ncbi:polyphosphate kinase 2 family protein [Gluconobacter sp. LMG 1744]|uniref:Polyphosphate kinase 2 family protein n=1 Tax=Gluconobacter cadivus TaxID=2728101 RepID=A0ABR9YXU9_9PROT|nr:MULTISPECIES: polyphosphate kinase 2 family protein [Gluconobacter]MBF0889379.1 polyphosphate kinase 2 family protein [Gluconobacter cadivus]MBF0892669.1 polyphosphate kinase 2 family protein [Gluconobacter cadivus]MBS1060917.1 polyphosphate kinase 2 family protein [Gluconobacter sp. Dm-44]MBS1076001.1 polyphosphate kinase 2 family protein [Gluconobacter sp. Dm-73]MBS1092859.1 polyphosphate kinase 2 family protein [Gluconobacter sp. Dm-74]
MSVEIGLPPQLRITDGKKFRLSSIPTNDKLGRQKNESRTRIRDCVDRMSVLQQRLAAYATHGILVVLQGMDTAGKDGAIRHAFSGLNPQGVHVTSFKAPAGISTRHDDLWRIHLAVPSRGEIGIFNRSHYEDVLVERVHPDMVRARGLNPDLPDFWDHRLQDLRNFESYLHRQNIIVLKLFLHISPEEQRLRLLKRLDHPEKRWKFSPSDIKEREFWPHYTAAYEEAIRATSTPEAPWIVIPSDHKWLARVLVAEALLDTLESLHLKEPEQKLSDSLRDAQQALLKGAAKTV